MPPRGVQLAAAARCTRCTHTRADRRNDGSARSPRRYAEPSALQNTLYAQGGVDGANPARTNRRKSQHAAEEHAYATAEKYI